MTESPSPTPRKRRRLLLKIFLAAVAALVLVVVFLPTIASLPLFRGFITDAVASKVNGKVSIGDMSFSWSGPQTIDNFGVVGDDGKSSVLVSLSLQNGFLELLSTTINQIDLTVSGKIAGAIGPDGKFSLLSLAKPAPAAPAVPARLPAAASPGAMAANWPGKIQVAINGFDVDIANANGPRFAVEGLKGKISMGGKGPMEVQLAAKTKIGDKPGAISVNGTFKDVMNAAGAFDPTAITGSLTGEVDGVLVPALGSSVEIAQAKFAVDAAAGKPIDLGADVNVSVNGQAAPVHAKLQAYRPSPSEPIASWAKDPRTWSGTVSVQNLSTALFDKFVQGTPISIARDVGPTLSLTAATGSGTGIDVSITAAQIQLQGSASIDVNTGAIQGKTTQLNASLDPALLGQFNVVTAKPLPVSIALQSFYIPPPLASGQFNLAQITAQGALNVAAVQFSSAGNAPVAMGPLNVVLAAAPLADKVDFSLQTTLNGASIDTKAALTGLMQHDAFTPRQMKVDCTTQLGPVDPTLLPGMPQNVVDMLRHVEPGSSTVKSALQGSYDAGSLTLAVQTVPGLINAKVLWDAASASITLEKTSMTIMPAVADWASRGSVKLAAPISCTVAAGPIKADRAALEKGAAGFAPSPVSIFADKIALARAPGLVGAATVQNAVVRGDFDLDGPLTFKGNVTAAAVIANGLPGGGNAAMSQLSVQAAVAHDPNSPESAVEITAGSLTLSNVKGLSETLLGKNMRVNFAGPLSMNGPVAASLAMDVAEASGPAAKIAGDFKTQSSAEWTAAVTASEVSTNRIAQLLGFGDVPEWTSGGAENAGKLKANLSSKSSAMTFAVNADLGRVNADINGSRGADGSITLAKSSAAASIPGGAVRNYLDNRPQKSPIRNLSDLKVALDISSAVIPSVNGALDPLAAGAALSTKARIEPFQVAFAPDALTKSSATQDPAKPHGPSGEAPPAAGAEKLVTLVFGATDFSLQTSGAQSAELDLNGGVAAEGQAAKPMTVKLRARDLAGRDGKLNVSTMKLVADVNISEFPSSVVDAVTNGDGFIPNLAGPVFSVVLNGQTGFDASDKFKGHVESPTLSLDIPAVRIANGSMTVAPNEAITLQIRPDDKIRQNILRPINPILSEIQLKNKSNAINTTVSMVQAPLPFDMTRTDARFVIEVGEVELEKKGQIISLLNLATVKDGKSTIPGLVSPLNGEVNKGILTYKDFKIQAGKQGETWQQTIISDADINLTTHPAYANAINVRYPLEGVTNAIAANAGMNSVMGELNKALGNTTAQMRQAIQLKVVFSGPLKGDQLKMTVEPALDIKSGDDLLKGLGGIAEGILNGKNGGAAAPGTTPGTTPAPQSKDPLGGLIDKFLKKPK